VEKEKKLKLDNLSLTELENKECNQITGGYEACVCACMYTRLDTKVYDLNEINHSSIG